MKKLFYLVMFLVSFLFAYLSWNVWQNNRDTTNPTRAEIKQSFDRSVDWAAQNYSSIKNSHNPILWWMLKQAVLNSENETLSNVFSQYKKNYLDKASPNLFTPLFDKFYQPKMLGIESISHFRGYQQFFVYGLSCDSDLGSEPVIQQQMVPGYCPLHYLNQQCITHQLLGLRYMQRYQCGYDAKISATIVELQKTVESELFWDFRVCDAYIQRVLMLVETGAYEKVRPIWIANILNAQNDDGGWDDLHPIAYLGDGTVFAHTTSKLKIKEPKSTFHATAQATWLLSILLNKS